MKRDLQEDIVTILAAILMVLGTLVVVALFLNMLLGRIDGGELWFWRSLSIYAILILVSGRVREWW